MVVSALVAAAVMAAARPAVIVNPDWVRKPSSEEVVEHYPKLMWALGVEGKAVIRCRVTVAGDVADCAPLFESPRGLGFAAGAIAMAPALKFRPKTVNGQPDATGTVNIPINFMMETDSDDARGSPLPRYEEHIDDKTRVLARRLATLLEPDRYRAGAAEQIDKIAEAMPKEGDAEARRRLVEAYKQAYGAFLPVA